MIGSLFSGIGGLELGLEMAGLGPVAWQCEQDPWCRKVLAKHWPDATRYEDVRTLSNPPRVDVMCGGFPCQDLSHAGKRAGLEGERSGLWWEYARLIHETQPRYVVIENVPGLLSDPSPVVVPPGLDWLGDRPTRPLHGAFGAVLWSLDALGFDAVWDCVPASAVGAPHRRDRVFIVAYADGRYGRRGASRTGRDQPDGPTTQRNQGHDRTRDGGPMADANGGRDQHRLRLPAVEGSDRSDPDGCDWSSAIRAARNAAPWRYVGHAQEFGYRPRGLPIGAEAQVPDAGLASDVGNTQQHGPQGQQHPRAASGPTVQPDGAGAARQAQPGLGRVADGLPAGVDRPWQPWEGDTPRVAPKGPDWKHRGKALGNAVVPQVGLVAGLVVRQLMGAA